MTYWRPFNREKKFASTWLKILIQCNDPTPIGDPRVVCLLVFKWVTSKVGACLFFYLGVFCVHLFFYKGMDTNIGKLF